MLIFFRWQFSQLLFNRPILFELTNKCIIRIDKGRSGITGSLYMGLLEYWEMCFVTRIMEEDDLFLDIGANVGVYSILAGVHGKSECHSFEPVPSTFEILSQNFLLNKIKGKVYNLGVSNSEGHLFFSTENDCVNKVVEDDYIGIKTKVAVTSIDSLKLSNRYVGIKLDIEGHEYYALEGMIETFLNNRILFVLVENNDPRVFCFLEELGFITYGYNVDSNSCIKIES
jgi:FkbM family methyltransferase